MLRILLNSFQLLSIECIESGQLPSDRFIKEPILSKDDLQRGHAVLHDRSSGDLLFFLPFVEQRSRTLPDALFVHIRPRAERGARRDQLTITTSGKVERQRDFLDDRALDRYPSPFFPQAGARLPKLQASRLRVPSPLPSLLLLHFLLALFYLSLFLSSAAISSFARYIGTH